MKAWNVVYDFCIAVQCLLLNSYFSNSSGSAFSHAGQLTFPKFSWQTIYTLREAELFLKKMFEMIENFLVVDNLYWMVCIWKKHILSKNFAAINFDFALL